MARKPTEKQKSSDVKLPQLTPEVLEVVEGIAEERAVAVATSTIMQYSGPLPPPKMLAEYEKIHPGITERMMTRMEMASDHRMAMESATLDKEYSLKGRGQNYALLSTLILSSVAAYIAYLGDTKAAMWIICSALVLIVGVHITGKIVESKSRDVDRDTEEADEADEADEA